MRQAGTSVLTVRGGRERASTKMGSLRKLQELNIASIPVDVSREGHGDEDEETTVCPDLVLILGALLCALILALLINYVVRWLLRCARVVITVPVPLQPRHGSGSASVAGSASASASAKDAFAALPSVVYRREEALKMKGESECAICLAEFGDGEKLCVLPVCGHCFHGTCIRQWIACHPSCPNCRANLHSRGSAVAAAAAACTCSPPSMSLFIALPLLPSSPRRPS